MGFKPSFFDVLNGGTYGENMAVGRFFYKRQTHVGSDVGTPKVNLGHKVKGQGQVTIEVKITFLAITSLVMNRET